MELSGRAAIVSLVARPLPPMLAAGDRLVARLGMPWAT
jgi:hypothetical protein